MGATESLLQSLDCMINSLGRVVEDEPERADEIARDVAAHRAVRDVLANYGAEEVLILLAEAAAVSTTTDDNREARRFSKVAAALDTSVAELTR